MTAFARPIGSSRFFRASAITLSIGAALVVAWAAWAKAESPNATATKAVAANPPTTPSAAVLSDNWFSTTIDGKQVGYFHERREQTREGSVDVIRTTMVTTFSIRRLDNELTVESDALFVETADGDPLRFTSHNRLSSSDYEINAERKGDVFLVTQKAEGKTTETDIPYTDDILFPHAIDRRIAEAKLEPGGQLILRTFSPDLARPTKLTIDYKGIEPVRLGNGTEHMWARYESSQDLVPGVRLVEWRDDTGLMRSELPLLGVTIVSQRSTREQALLPPERVELMISTLIDPKTLLAHPRKISRAVFELRFKTKEIADTAQVPQDERQIVKLREAQSTVLEIHKEHWLRDATVARAGPSYLTASSALQVDDPRIQQLARDQCGSGNPQKVAGRLAEWVYRAIDKKSLSVGFATAAEVARERRGDCTEHAVLAAAMARACGIPARVAVGLVYVNGVFGYHMWTEVFDAGWHAVDPAFGQAAADATHIKLATSGLDNGFVDEALVGLVQLIASLDIQVIEYEIDGQVYKPSAVMTSGAIRDGRYTNSLLGLTIGPPAGWTMKTFQEKPGDPRLLALTGPGGLRGDLSVTTIGYGFDLESWVVKGRSGCTVADQKAVPLSNRVARRFILASDTGREAVYTFLEQETLFSLRVGPIQDGSESVLARLVETIEIK